MTKLSVNVNKLATLRNSRGKNLPDVGEFARRILGWGAQGITVHPRPDGRHIRSGDVIALSALVREQNASGAKRAEFNIEGYPSSDYLALVDDVRPDQATLVPDPPEALTSSAGWRLHENRNFLSQVIRHLRKANVRVSIFIEPQTMTDNDYEVLGELKPDRVELYTEAFADAFGTANESKVLALYRSAAERARELGIGVNAGHDLNQRNLAALLRAIPWIAEVSIGHALICEALDAGMESTIRAYLRILG